MYKILVYHLEMLYVPVCRTTTTAVHSIVVFCRFRISRPAVPGTRHDTTRVSTSTPNENVDHEELQLVLDGCWRRLGNTWVVRVVVLWWCCGIPRCFEVQKGFLGVCSKNVSGCVVLEAFSSRARFICTTVVQIGVAGTRGLCVPYNTRLTCFLFMCLQFLHAHG